MTKYTNIILITILSLTTISAQAYTENVRYFAKLAGVISPLLEYNPRGEISEQRAKTINHYEVIFDNEQRIESIKYFQLGKPSSNAYFRAHEVRYSYSPALRTRSYFDTSGKPTTMWRHYYQSGDIHIESYQLDGNKTTLTMFDTHGMAVGAGTNSWKFTAEQIDDKKFVQRQFKKDGSANWIFDYLPFEVSLITKNENGHLYQIIHLDNKTLKRAEHETAGFAEMRLNFDKYGNEMGWEFRDVNGDLTNRGKEASDPGYAVWQYDMKWRDREIGSIYSYIEHYKKADGSRFCKPSGVCSTQTSQDERGNWLGLKYLDDNQQLIVNPDSNYAQVTFDVDKNGIRQAIKFFSDDGKLRKEGVAITRYYYHSDGSETRRNFDYQNKEIIEEITSP